jgi:hypothetical protein
VAECGGARQCVPAGDKEGSDSPTAAAAELEVAARGKNTMLAPEDIVWRYSARGYCSQRRARERASCGAFAHGRARGKIFLLNSCLILD